MKVTTVSANIRYSRDTGQGAWKVVELGAEATIDGKEGWKDAQASLYADLGQQLKTLWANGNGRKATEAPEYPTEAPSQPEPTQTPPLPPEHYCQQHQTEYRRYERDGRVWYSHKTGDGKWCREKD
jgi:hypothetical protein